MDDITKAFHELSKSNLNGLVAFIERLARHDGTINLEHLEQVILKNKKPCLIQAESQNKKSDYSIMIGGEVPNSFCPLYEIAYFLQALLLAGIATPLLKANRLSDYRLNDNRESRLKQIREDILNLDSRTIFKGLQNPLISIVANLDTDIEPYRYVKHQLWRLSPSAFKKRTTEITKAEFGQADLDRSLENIYWVKDDHEIAEIAIANASNLCEAKALQYFLSLRKFLNYYGIDISQIPFYFNFVPKEEILKLGPKNELLNALIELHERENVAIYSKIVKRRQPWLFSLSCPHCGESSKKILSSRIKSNGQVVRVVCSTSPKVYLNEADIRIIRNGCGHVFEVHVPKTSEELFELFQKNSFTINFPARDLLGLIKNTAYQPCSWPVTDISIKRISDDKIENIKGYPKGFGDHLSLLSSTLTVQRLFIEGHIAKRTSYKLKKNNLILKKEIQLLGYNSPSKLYDESMPLKCFKDLYVSDTSAFKAIKHGITPISFLKKAIDINYYSLSQLIQLAKLDKWFKFLLDAS